MPGLFLKYCGGFCNGHLRKAQVTRSHSTWAQWILLFGAHDIFPAVSKGKTSICLTFWQRWALIAEQVFNADKLYIQLDYVEGNIWRTQETWWGWYKCMRTSLVIAQGSVYIVETHRGQGARVTQLKVAQLMIPCLENMSSSTFYI